MYATEAAANPARHRNITPRKRIGSILAAILAIIAIFVAVSLWYLNYVPSNLDTSTEKLSSEGIYLVSYQPGQTPVPINELHSMTLLVTSASGAPITDALIRVDGDMPQHGHGLPTQPRATKYLGDGRYLVEGVKFQMTGWWFLEFRIASESFGEDDVRFDFVLP